jgi:N-acetylglucosaminyl-diphospho-decaprenol L-rhamnosyltransferase
MKLLVIIVNYKTADLTIDAMASLGPELGRIPGSRAIVVDNDSRDGSGARLKEAIASRGWNRWATLIEAERNGGFAYGNNVGIRAAQAEGLRPAYVHLLNPDTIVRPGALTTLLAFMDTHPEAGIAGSRLEDPDGTPQRSGFRFPGVMSELDAGLRLGVVSRLLRRWEVAPPVQERDCQVDWVAGASMIIRDKVLDDVGLLDESYFMYYEEVDFILRARRAGWSCWYVPESHVVHLVGQASGVTDPQKQRRRRPAYWFESRRRYFVRHLGPIGAGLADLAFAAGHVSWRARRVLQGKADDQPEKFLWDFARHSVIVRGPGS